MNRRKDARIYILYHKKYEMWDNSLYMPQSVHKSEIADLNPIYCELTGLYDIWKKHPKTLKYIGVCQYRRRLQFEEDYDFGELFDISDILCAQPYQFNRSVRQQYALCHNVDDLDLMEKILKENYPDYAQEWDNRVRGGNVLFYSQGWVARAEDFDNYCEWLFDLLGKFCKEAGIETVEQCHAYVEKNNADGKYRDIGEAFKKYSADDFIQYQMRICGYLAERLFTVWVFKNFKDIAIKSYIKFEN